MPQSNPTTLPYWERQVYDFLREQDAGAKREEIVAATHLGTALVDAALSKLQRRARVRVTTGAEYWTTLG